MKLKNLKLRVCKALFFVDKVVKESWIVIITKDLKTDRELVFEGAFKKGDEVVPRLLALYNQDENHVKTTSYTLTPPN